jgi:hypothetical protein
VTYSLAVVDGDLAQQGSSLAIVYGVNKLRQDLTLWMTERHGIDRFHPTMGTILPDFIGQLISASTKTQIQGEVLRVLQGYQAYRQYEFKRAPQNFSYSEMLYSVNAIDVALSFDTVYASIKVSALDGTPSAVAVAQSV